MIAKTALLALLAGLFAAETVNVKAAPVENDPSEAIVGGQDAEPFSLPWMASLQFRGRHFCGGSMIAPNMVLTAGHCTVFLNETQWPNVTVNTWRHNINQTVEAENGIQFKVLNHIVHPDYKEPGGVAVNDVAVWVLEETVNPQKKAVKTVQLSTAEPAGGSTVDIAGWGWTEPSGPNVATVLQKTSAPVIGDWNCRFQYLFAAALMNGDAFTCVGKTGFKPQTACRGDSGGPIFTTDANGEPVVHGVTSWGAVPCGTRPGVFAQVSTYRDWILDQVAQFGAKPAGN
ncbi:Serine protease [Quaeritorhiza haematococci]|nr:Serine protease [Quaeritorhiza haematococci]